MTDSALPLPFRNREEVGRQLAEALAVYQGRARTIVLGLPRGGVPVACEVAKRLRIPFDLMLVRKLGVPFYGELAMGALASGGVRVLNDDVVREYGLGSEDIEAAVKKEQEELERREKAYRGERPWPSLQDKTVILVDDGIATGATMLAAVDAAREQRAEQVVVATPVAPADTVERLRRSADRVVCLATPEPFYAIGAFYRDFSQMTDREVVFLLQQAWEGEERSSPSDTVPSTD